MCEKENIIIDLIKSKRKQNKYSQLELSSKIGLPLHHYSFSCISNCSKFNPTQFIC